MIGAQYCRHGTKSIATVIVRIRTPEPPNLLIYNLPLTSFKFAGLRHQQKVTVRTDMHPHSQYHVYALPVELLHTLTPRNLVNNTPPRSPSPEQTATTTTSSGPRTCNICLGTTFLDLEAQRAHFRSDWHRYNVKTRLTGGNTVDDITFSQLVDGMFRYMFFYV